MSKLAGDGPGQCATVTKDVYKRVVATCYADGVDLGEAMGELLLLVEFFTKIRPSYYF